MRQISRLARLFTIFSLPVLALAVAGPAAAVTVENIAFDAGVGRFDGVLLGTQPYFVEFNVDGSDVSNVTVTLPDGLTEFSLNQDGDEFSRQWDFANLTDLTDMFPDGNYTWTFEDSGGGSAQVTAPHLLMPTSDFARINSPVGPIGEIPTSIDWTCDQAICDGNNPLFVGLFETNDGADLIVRFDLPTSTNSLSIPANLLPGAMIVAGQTYDIDVSLSNLSSFMVFQNVGTGPANYLDIFNAENETSFIVPEPESLSLAALTLLGLLLRRGRASS